MLKKLKEGMKRGKKSIKVQVMCLIWVVTIPISILFFITTNESLRVIISQKENSLQTTADIYINQLDEDISTINYYIYNLCTSNSNFAEIKKQEASTAYERSRINLINEMYSHIGAAKDADVYYFYAEKQKSGGISMNSEYDTMRRDVLSKYLYDCEFLKQYQKWSMVTLDGEEWLMRNTSLYGMEYGALINLEDIRNVVLENIDLISADVQWGFGDIEENKQKIQVKSKSEKSDIKLMICVDKDEIIQTLPLLQRFGYWIAVANLLISILSILILKHIVLEPLAVLNKALLVMKNGNTRIRIEKKAGSQDFQNTYTYFNEMINEIMELKIENYEKELSRQDMELKNLQLQIRPHFLLNTFNLLYSLVAIGEIKSGQKLILYLTDYFRYLFQSEKNMEFFSREINLIKHYAEIATINYPGQIEMEYQIAPEMDSVEVPALMVHNFVENIIRHALSPEKKVHVFLSATCIRNQVVIKIEDDGAGMDETMVQQLNQSNFTYEDTKIHVGWKNSVRRLKYFYGEEASIHVESAPGKGCRVVIRFQCRDKDEVKENGIVNC